MIAVGAGAKQQAPTFRAGAVLVTVDVYPQQNGRIVEGLNPDDFEVLEDGKPQKVENFEFVRIQPALSEEARRDPNSGDEGNKLAADPKNRVFVLFLDHKQVTLTGSHDIRKPLVDTLRQLLSATDLFGVMTAMMRPRDLVFGRSLMSIEDQLARYWSWGEKDRLTPATDEMDLYNHFELNRCGVKRWFTDGATQRPLPDVLLARKREDETLLSLERLIDHLGQLRESRTAILLVTAGWRLFEPDQKLAEEAWDKAVCPGESGPPPPPIPVIGRMGGQLMLADKSVDDKAAWSQELQRLANLDNQRRFRALILQGQQRNITFYPVNAEGLEVFDDPLSQRSRPANRSAVTTGGPLTQSLDRVTERTSHLRELAENTGGIAVVNSNDLAGGLRRIVDDTSAYYLLGYYSPTTKLDGAYHRIEVKLKRPGTTVKARRGYFAPSAAAEAAKVEKAAASAVAAPVADALAALSRLRPSAELYGYGFRSGSELKLVVEIPSASTAGGKFQQGADVEAALTGSAATIKARIEPASRGVVVSLPLDAGSTGPWRIDLKVSSGADRLEDKVTIDAVTPGTLLGEPIAYRAAPGPRSPIRPVADFQFRRTERVHIEWPVLKPLDQRQARLLGKNGLPLAVAANVTEQSDPSTALGAGVLSIDFNLAPLSAGDYVIELTAGAGAITERRLLAVRVIQN